ncbi:MAG: hypothetical protein FWE46_00860 [Coriobacteriia bacterium]|nr:hypothetical protein [Coriobacteriia bacterium]MCL2537705.1 hypothetical protein [Coriobacteriia bacterium]
MFFEQHNLHNCPCSLIEILKDGQIAVHFGRVLRKARLKEHFLSCDSLATEMRCRCGIQITGRTIYRYEKGLTQPSVEFLVAASLVLSPHLFTNLLTEILSPGLIGRFEMRQAAAHYDASKQLPLFKY